MTRAAWRKADRWRRVTQKQLAEADRRLQQRIATLADTDPAIAATLAQNLINPPVLLGRMFEGPYNGS